MAKSIKPNISPELLRMRRHVAQLIASKRHDLAEGVIRQILASRPNDATANLQLSFCMFRFRRYEEAIEHARIAASIDPNPLALCQMASIHMVKNEVDEAMDLFRQAVALRPDHFPSIAGMATTYALKKKYEEALEWTDRGLAVKPDHCGILRTRAESLAALKREPEAMAAMEQFLRLEPDSVESHAAAGNTLRRLGKTEEAAKFAQRAMQMKPDDPYLHNSLAQLKLKERNYEDAGRHFESAAEIYESRKDGQKGPVGIEIHSLMGQAVVNLKKRQFPLAEAQYRRVMELDPNHASALGMIAGVVGKQFRFDEAFQLAREAVERQPSQLHCKLILAELLSDTEQYEEAMSVARHAAELRPDSFLPHLAMASIYLDMEDYANALVEAEKARAISVEPSSRRALAVALAGLGRREQAIQQIELVLQDDPEGFSSHGAAGYAYYLLGDFEKAQSHLLRTMEIDVSGIGCPGKLGLVYLAQGKAEQALPLLEKSHQRNPHVRRVREALQKIKGNASDSTAEH
jgi:superkiller protein 3